MVVNYRSKAKRKTNSKLNKSPKTVTKTRKVHNVSPSTPITEYVLMKSFSVRSIAITEQYEERSKQACGREMHPNRTIIGCNSPPDTLPIKTFSAFLPAIAEPQLLFRITNRSWTDLNLNFISILFDSSAWFWVKLLLPLQNWLPVGSFLSLFSPLSTKQS